MRSVELEKYKGEEIIKKLLSMFLKQKFIDLVRITPQTEIGANKTYRKTSLHVQIVMSCYAHSRA